MVSLADPELQKRGGGKFCAKFFQWLFLDISQKKFHFPKQISSITQNFLMTFFSHRPFQASSVTFLHRGCQTIDRGVKNLTFRKIYTATLIIRSSSKGGQTPLPISMVAMAGLAPWGPNSIANFDGCHGRIGPPGSATGWYSHTPS